MEHDEHVSQELIQDIANIFDIDEHLIKHFEHLQAKISNLKIKFEAHKITRGNNYGFTRKS